MLFLQFFYNTNFDRYSTQQVDIHGVNHGLEYGCTDGRQQIIFGRIVVVYYHQIETIPFAEALMQRI